MNGRGCEIAPIPGRRFITFVSSVRARFIEARMKNGGKRAAGEERMAVIEWKNAGNGMVVPAGEFELALETGFEPGEGFMKLGSQGFKELESRGEVTITVNFADGLPGTVLTIRDLYLGDYTRRTDPAGRTIYTVRMTDRRVRWKRFGEITLFANCQLPDGTLDPASLDGGRQYAWRELVLACVEAMGESANLEGDGSLPENLVAVRNVRWAGKNASEALGELLDAAGFTVALHYDGKLQIIKKGESLPRTVPDGYGPRRETGKLFNLVPGSVQVVGAPIVNEALVELEPCALDVDGEVKALGEVSYLQGRDVARELASEFAGLRGSPEAQAAARLSVGHYFRIPGTGGYADEKDSSNPGLVPVLLDPHRGGVPPSLKGAWFERDDKRRYRNVGGEGDLREFTRGFSVIDPARGLVYTNKVCGTLGDTETDALPCAGAGGPAKIEIVRPWLTFRHCMKEPGGAHRHWRFTCGEGLEVETVRRPDLQLVCRDGKPDPAVAADLEARAQEIAQAKMSVSPSVTVEVGTYAGVHGLKCDGVTGRVAWRADHAAGFTHYSYGPPSVPPHGGREVDFGRFAAPPAQPAAVPAGRELRLINANKHGPVVIRSSDGRRAALAGEGRRDDTEDNLFAELDQFDEEHQEPTLANLGPAERHNWRFRDHSPSPNPGPDSQDAVWALQLISDDKYRIESEISRSTEVIRLCDENRGDLDDIWRVRAVPSAGDVAADMEQRDDETRVKLISTHEAFRLMWLINTVTGGEGGWITDVPPEGLGLGKLADEKQVSPPRRIGQIGDIVILTNDDEIVQTRDGDLFTYANIRHDAHFHKTDQRDGRIHFTDTSPGTRPSGGAWLLGEMVCDPAVKNTDTNLGKESGQWCPQVRIPYLDGFSDDTVPDYFGGGGS